MDIGPLPTLVRLNVRRRAASQRPWKSGRAEGQRAGTPGASMAREERVLRIPAARPLPEVLQPPQGRRRISSYRWEIRNWRDIRRMQSFAQARGHRGGELRPIGPVESRGEREGKADPLQGAGLRRLSSGSTPFSDILCRRMAGDPRCWTLPARSPVFMESSGPSPRQHHPQRADARSSASRTRSRSNCGENGFGSTLT